MNVPASMEEERRTNLFLRTDWKALQRMLGTEDEVETLAELRRRKDIY